MHIHLPKPLHGWRELLGEVGVIVVGVLIALGAEQAIDSLHWRHRVHDAEAAMNDELRLNAEDAYYLLAIEPCSKAKLDEMQAALVAARDQGRPVAVIAPYRRPLRPWQNDAWDGAQALQIVSHIPTDRLGAYSRAYFFPAALRAIKPLEREAMDEIDTLSINAGRLQPAERDRLFHGIVRARSLLGQSSIAAHRLLEGAAPLGLGPSPGRQARQLHLARADYGACAAAPDLGPLKPYR